MKSFKQRYKALTQSRDYVAKETIFSTLSLIFVKVNRSKVNVYEISHGRLKSDPVVSLYENYITLHQWPYFNDPLYWKISSFMKIKFKDMHGYRLVTFSDGSRSVFFPGMKMTYGGKPVLPYPKKRQRETENEQRILRERKSVENRFYYQRKKAAERFQAAAEYHEEERFGGMHMPTQTVTVIDRVDVSQLPVTDVFKLENVSHRQYLIDYYGLDAILASLDSEVIDTDVINGNPYELVGVKFPSARLFGATEPGTYLRMINPSTDEVHFEGVPNYDRSSARSNDSWDRNRTILTPTVKAALAWRDGETRYTVPKKIT